MWYKKLLTGLTNAIFSIVQIFLVLRFVLKLFGANPGAPFVRWIYDTSAPLLYPFRGMFASPVIERGLVLEFSTLFAIIIYALLAWVIIEFIYFLSGLKDKKERSE